MRILHLDSGKEMRGGQWQVLRLVQALNEAGFESTLLARSNSPLAKQARIYGQRVQPIGLLRIALLSRSYDLVHAHDAHSHTLAAMTALAPLIVSRRVAFPIQSSWKYAQPVRYIAVSQFVKDVLIQGGVPQDKISVVYDGVPLKEEAVGLELMAPATGKDRMKGEPLALEAAKLAGVPLMISSNLDRDLHQARAFLYISHSEGLGSAALLAMSAGVPVIASRIGGLPEIVRHGETGLLVENKPAAIADAIRELTSDPERARRYGQAARQAVIDRYTVGHNTAATIEVYRQVFA
ncbi:MAG TPA: glycosyltransferase family 4 protein [Candidatus Sulfopaludibacter sp.]|jgi:glycosyltransferase involved in cell wall biosynthesis|nr:glycosyltransferase family 4 protein [Candidatus Sulfopaludibacter sp.]